MVFPGRLVHPLKPVGLILADLRPPFHIVGLDIGRIGRLAPFHLQPALRLPRRRDEFGPLFGEGGRPHHDVEVVAHGGATGVSGGHFYRNRLHIRSRRRTLEGPRGGGEGQPCRQVRAVTLRRRVAQGVAGVGVGKRGVRELIAERRVCRRRLVRNRVRHHGGVVGGRPHRDIEYVADQPAVAVVGGHLHCHRLHIRSRRRALEGPRGGGEGQPCRQVRAVTLRRRVAQGVAAVGVGKRGVREGVAEQRALRRCLVRDRDRDHRGVVVGGAGGGIDDIGGSGAGADAVDGRDAVVAGGAGGQPGVLVGGGGAGGVGDQVGPGSTAIDGDLDLVAGDDTAAIVDRGGPREVDRGRSHWRLP